MTQCNLLDICRRFEGTCRLCFLEEASECSSSLRNVGKQVIRLHSVAHNHCCENLNSHKVKRQAMKTYGGTEAYVHVFLASRVHGGELSTSHPEREPGRALDRKLGGTEGQSIYTGDKNNLFLCRESNSDNTTQKMNIIFSSS